MSLVATHVETVCPRCERTVAYSVGHDPVHGWYLVPEGRAETEYGYVWLAHRTDLRELVLEVFLFLKANFPDGGKKGEIVKAVSEAFDLIPAHVEILLEKMRDEGVIYKPSENEVKFT